MISVIVCSYREHLFDSLSKSIEETIGVPFEILRAVNFGEKGICEVYNNSSEQAKFDILCFVHEDICFENKKWGLNVINHFNNDCGLGLVGIAGCAYKTYIPSGWTFPHMSKFVYMNLKQGNANSITLTQNDYFELKTPSLINYVCTIDGCFMATKKEIWKKIRFDEVLFKSFHCYDIDFSLAVGQYYKVAVVNDINLFHLSDGKFGIEWLTETLNLHKKWKIFLPKSVQAISRKEKCSQELGAFSYLLIKIMDLKYNKFELYKILVDFKTFNLLGFKSWFILILRTTNQFLK